MSDDLCSQGGWLRRRRSRRSAAEGQLQLSLRNVLALAKFLMMLETHYLSFRISCRLQGKVMDAYMRPVIETRCILSAKNCKSSPFLTFNVIMGRLLYLWGVAVSKLWFCIGAYLYFASFIFFSDFFHSPSFYRVPGTSLLAVACI